MLLYWQCFTGFIFKVIEIEQLKTETKFYRYTGKQLKLASQNPANNFVV